MSTGRFLNARERCQCGRTLAQHDRDLQPPCEFGEWKPQHLLGFCSSFPPVSEPLTREKFYAVFGRSDCRDEQR